jgi:hypothetical protein
MNEDDRIKGNFSSTYISPKKWWLGYVSHETFKIITTNKCKSTVWYREVQNIGCMLS